MLYEYTRAGWYHLKFVYHDTIIRVSRYTLGIDTSKDKQPTQDTFYVKMQFY